MAAALGLGARPRPADRRRAAPPGLAARERAPPAGRAHAEGRDRHRQHVLLEPGQRQGVAGPAAIAWPRGRGRAVVVTPGMVELGRRQFEENRQFAIDADDVATDFVIVGRDEPQGAAGGRAASRHDDPQGADPRRRRDLGAGQHLRDGDAVLYENDLPDHYP